MNTQKPHVNVGTLGHIDHGKTTLTSAITKVAGKYVEFDKIDKSPEEKKRGITISATHVDYETEHRHYGHIDCPGHADYVKNMITGASMMDIGILVVSAEDGPKPQTREHILLSKQSGVENMVVFINKSDLIQDEEFFSLIELEIQELLEQYKYDSSKVKFIRGSATGALNNEEKWVNSIKELLATLDSIEISIKNLDKPFRLNIESVSSIVGRGEVATGVIKAGKIKPGSMVDFFSKQTGKIQPVTVTSIEMFHKELDEAYSGLNVGCLLRGIKKGEIKRGDILGAPKTLTTHSKFKGSIYILTAKEGGRKTPIVSGFKPQAFINTADITCKLILPDFKEMLMPGDSAEINFELMKPYVISEGDRLSIREGNQTVGSVLITQILD